MEIQWKTASLGSWEADGIVFLAFEKPALLPSGLGRWVEQQARWLRDLLDLDDFQGKHQQVAAYYAPPGGRIPRVVCVGLGPEAKLDLFKLRSAVAAGLRKCREMKLRRVAFPLMALEGLPFLPQTALRESLLGGLSGLYRYTGFKTRDLNGEEFPELLVLTTETDPGDSLRDEVEACRALMAGVALARDLASAPANEATPSHLVAAARRLSDAYGFKLHVMDVEEARNLGMGAFAAVAQGSREPAYLIVLEHAPPGTESDRPLVFVGKGITFDTGGISLKPGDKMEAMKHDMAGAAAVLGAFEVLGRESIPRRVIGIMPCTENMPDGKAYKPGDVVRSLSGLTIEVISTDAEGRMVLCDALTYSQRFDPCAIVDLATLTGACVVALGHHFAGILGNREGFVRAVQDIGWEVGDRVWPLPLYDFYFEGIKSDVADFKNVGDRSGGAIVGGIFLQQFIPDTIPWIHLDIAGTAWTTKDLIAIPQGATGFGVRILVELARRWHAIAVE